MSNEDTSNKDTMSNEDMTNKDLSNEDMFNKDMSNEDLHNEDPVLRYIGNFGKWQARTIGIIPFITLFAAWQLLVKNFLLPSNVPFWCLPSDFPFVPETATWTSPPELDPNTGNPKLDANNKTIRNSCLMYQLDYKDLITKPNTTGLPTTTCTHWEYDRTQYPETLISQFDLVCDREYLRSLSTSIFFIGTGVGAVVSGIISDKYGRKLTLLLSSVGMLLFGIASAFSPYIELLIFLRGCVALCTISAYSSGYLYCMEIVGGKWHTLLGIGYQVPFSLGYMALAGLAWLLPNWNHLLLAISAPIILFIIPVAIPALVPESPRWMLFNGKSEQALKLLKSAAKLNGRTVVEDPEEIFTPPTTEDQPSASFLDLFRSRRLLSRTLVMYFLWFTTNLVYYGLCLNTDSLIPGSLHVNVAIDGALEMPAAILSCFCLLKLGRRWSLCGSMVLGGSALLLTAAVPTDTAKDVFAHIGKLFITCSKVMIYVYAVEIFPTVVRGVGLGSSSMFGRVGGVLTPLFGHELVAVSKIAPAIIFGLLSVLAGLLTLLLPETNNKVLPDTIEEGEHFGEDQDRSRMCPCNL